MFLGLKMETSPISNLSTSAWLCDCDFNIILTSLQNVGKVMKCQILPRKWCQKFLFPEIWSVVGLCKNYLAYWRKSHLTGVFGAIWQKVRNLKLLLVNAICSGFMILKVGNPGNIEKLETASESLENFSTDILSPHCKSTSTEFADCNESSLEYLQRPRIDYSHYFFLHCQSTEVWFWAPDQLTSSRFYLALTVALGEVRGVRKWG